LHEFYPFQKLTEAAYATGVSEKKQQKKTEKNKSHPGENQKRGSCGSDSDLAEKKNIKRSSAWNARSRGKKGELKKVRNHRRKATYLPDGFGR